MLGDNPVTFIDNFEKKQNKRDNSKKILELKLGIFNEQIPFCIDVTSGMLRLSDIVQFARELSSKVSNIILEKMRNNEIPVPCRKGCAACCSYLVPLSVPEAFHLREEVLAMPEGKRKSVLDLFLSRAGRILKEKPEDADLMNINHLSNWYANLELTCPFLSDNLCTVYDKRPIACREYLVESSEILCRPGEQGGFHKVDLPVSVLECLGKLSAELEQTEVEAIMMPLALPWAEENLFRNERKWPALEIIQRLTEIIEESNLLPECFS